MKPPSCEEQIDGELEDTLHTLKVLWESYCEGEEYCENEEEDVEGFWPDYGLSFDYVPPNTFTDQREGFYCYQLSCGGPQDEFRFFPSNWDGWRVEYWFLDWNDGASRTLHAKDRALLLEILECFEEVGGLEAHKSWRGGEFIG